MPGQDIAEEPDLRLAGLSIWAKSRAFPESEDYWDGNWLSIRARVEAPGAFVEIIGPWLRSDDVARFADELATLHRDLRGYAELKCIEPMLHAKVVCGSGGELKIWIEATPDLFNQLHRFDFFLDQTYLDAILLECRRLLERFPVKDPDQRLI